MNCKCGAQFPEIGLGRIQSSVVQAENDPDYIVLILCHCGKFFVLTQAESTHPEGTTFTSIPAFWQELVMPQVAKLD